MVDAVQKVKELLCARLLSAWSALHPRLALLQLLLVRGTAGLALLLDGSARVYYFLLLFLLLLCCLVFRLVVLLPGRGKKLSDERAESVKVGAQTLPVLCVSEKRGQTHLATGNAENLLEQAHDSGA